MPGCGEEIRRDDGEWVLVRRLMKELMSGMNSEGGMFYGRLGIEQVALMPNGATRLVQYIDVHCR